MRTKEYDEAIRFYTNSVNYDPSEPTTYCNRALAYIKKLNFQRGLKDCEEAIRLKSDYSKAYYRKALCLVGLKRFPEALEDLLYILKDSPSNEEIMSELKSLKQKWKESINAEEWNRLEREIDQDIENAKINEYQFKYISQKKPVKESEQKLKNQDTSKGHVSNDKNNNENSSSNITSNNNNNHTSGFKKIKIVEEEIEDLPSEAIKSKDDINKNNNKNLSSSASQNNITHSNIPVNLYNPDINKKMTKESGENNNISPHLSKKFFI
jgi:tetratricopeptide (TPR) repeat protein